MHALIAQLRKRRAELVEAAEKLSDTASTEARDLTPEEHQSWTDQRAEIDGIDVRIKEYQEAEERELEAAKVNAKVDQAAERSNTTVRSPHTYRKGGENRFLRDAFAAREGDPEAAQRIARHQAEMRDAYQERGVELRTGATANYAGLTVPIYLTDDYAALARAGRPFANALPSADLPPIGMTVNISRITTGATTAVQATENSAASETDIDDTLLTIPVVTIAGAESVSFQALDRAALAEDIIMADMALSYATTLDNQLLNGAGSGGEHTGINTLSGTNGVTYTDASPTVPELYSKIADAVQQVNSNRYAPANLIVMHPRRWGWFLAALDGQNRPLVVPNPGNSFNVVGTGDAAAFGAGVGTIMGLPVITDASVTTTAGGGTEDRIYVTRTFDQRLWEEPGSPLFLRFERQWSPSKKNLTDVAVCYGYSAFTAGRYPKSTSVISGTGLAAPTF